MRAMADTLGATGATLFATDSNSSAAPFLATTGINDEGWKEYDEHYINVDPRVQFGMRQPMLSNIYDYRHISEDDLRKDDYYDWLLKYDYKYYLATILLKDNNYFGWFSIQRTPAEGHVQKPEIEFFHKLLPHVQRAAQIRQHIADQESRALCSADVMDRFAFGVLILDKRARVIHVNTTGDRIVRRRDGLAIQRDQSLTAIGRGNLHLQRLISGALGHVGLAEARRSGGQMALERSSGARPYGMLIAPLTAAGSRFATRPPAAVVIITDPDNETTGLADGLRHSYGLAPAEAHLVEHLVTGGSLTEYAEQRGVSVGTVRWTTKQIFAKTQTHSQSDLIRLVLGSALPLRAGDRVKPV